jgi:glycosyltransferase involved in cell wall biosynthesis
MRTQMNGIKTPDVLIGFAPYPHLGWPQHFPGGDHVVNELIRRVLASAGYRVETIQYKETLQRYAALNSLKRFRSLYHFAVPLFYARLINRSGRRYAAVICDSKVSLGVRHPRRINLFHFSYEGYRRRVGRYWSLPKRGWYQYFVFVEKHGANQGVNVAVSPFLQDILVRQGIPVDRVISNAVDAELFCPRPGFAPSGDLLYAGGHHHYAKGFDVLAAIAAKGLRIDCVTDSDPGNPLHYIPARPHAQMPSVYREHRMLLLPSRFESCPMAPLEAMACGLPSIISDVGFAAHLRSQIPEFVVSGYDEAAVERYLEAVGVIRRNYEEFSFKARAYAVAHHSYDQFRTAWLSLVNEVVAGK